VSLNRFEKVAGRLFREEARKSLAISLAESPEYAPCDPTISFFRHDCEAEEGRTRSIQLFDVTLCSPELWVTWSGEELFVIAQDRAASLVAEGTPVEAEVILAGKFSFTWKRGTCRNCGLVAISPDGLFRDARPRKGLSQDDLASMTGGVRELRNKEIDH